MPRLERTLPWPGRSSQGGTVHTTCVDSDSVESYYRAVALFKAAEMRGRDALAEWRGLARRLASRRILDLGCGAGRVGRALMEYDPLREVVGVDVSRALLGNEDPPFAFVRADMRAIPLDEEFDLIVAANDPFAHLLEDADRATAIAEARRLLAHDGLLVIDGLYLPPQDQAAAEAPEGLVRERWLDDGTRVRAGWRALGAHRYHTLYAYARDGTTLSEASASVRAWHSREGALPACGGRIARGLDQPQFDPWGERLVPAVPCS